MKLSNLITGNGNAAKEQVAAMVQNMLKIHQLPDDLDATDGLAAAVCHTYQNNSTIGDKKYSGWDAFIKDNAKRVK